MSYLNYFKLTNYLANHHLSNVQDAKTSYVYFYYIVAGYVLDTKKGDSNAYQIKKGQKVLSTETTSKSTLLGSERCRHQSFKKRSFSLSYKESNG